MGKKIPISLGFIFVLIAILVQIINVEVIRDWISRLENLAYDMQVKTQLLTQHHAAFQTDIAIVDIDDKSLQAEGRWPWSRSKLAALTDTIRAAGAVVIAFDVLFPQVEANIATTVLDEISKENLLNDQEKTIFQKITPHYDTDAQFSNSLGHGDDVLCVSFLPQLRTEGVLPPPVIFLTSQQSDLGFIEPVGYIGINPILAKTVKHVGFINAFSEEDGVIRNAPLFVRYKNGLYPSLPFAAVQLYLLSSVKLITAPYGQSIRLEGIQLGNSIIPTNQKSEVIIPFRGPSYTFPYYSSTDVLHKKFKENSFEGKIVFVGSTATALGDVRATPVTNAFPGVEINATIADALLKNDFFTKPTWAIGAEVFITAFLGIIFVFIFPYLGPVALAVCIFLIPSVLIFANNWLAIHTGMILSILVPITLVIFLAVLNIIYGYFFETRQRVRLKEIFGQYVPPQHIETMMKSKGEYGLYGEDREMSVLFADIRSFTTISESLTASQIKQMLNQFFTPMTEIIFKYQGTIDKYIGDLIMAFWGAPIKTEQHAEQALDSALDMQTKVTELKPVFAKEGWPEINIGIGVNTGEMSIGDMGSKFRRNYTVLGDAVNLGSRVEGLTKFYGVKIITTETTVKGQTKFAFRLLDRVQVKGKHTGVEIYEVMCRSSELTDEQKNELELYHSALSFYYKQDWNQAKKILSELKNRYPDLYIYNIFLERIDEYTKTPPPSDWNGIYKHTSK